MPGETGFGVQGSGFRRQQPVRLRNAERRALNPALCWLLLAITLTAGCDRGPAPPKRGKLEGKVTLNGKPLASGKIRFLALDPNGTNVVADIRDGAFTLPADQGPTKGKYRVEFSVPSATKRRIPNDDVPGQFIEEAPETLPPRYHRDSNIVHDFDPDQPASHDFQLATP
jgi:hypothetical protein